MFFQAVLIFEPFPTHVAWEIPLQGVSGGQMPLEVTGVSEHLVTLRARKFFLLHLCPLPAVTLFLEVEPPTVPPVTSVDFLKVGLFVGLHVAPKKAGKFCNVLVTTFIIVFVNFPSLKIPEIPVDHQKAHSF